MSRLPTDPNSLYQHAVQLHQAGQLQAAIQIYRDLWARFPKNTNVLFFLGTAECQLGDFQNGADHLGRFIKDNPRNAEAYNNRGNALKELGRFEEATKCYQKAIALNPRDATLHAAFAQFQKERGHVEGALRSFEEALSIDPDFIEALNNYGLLLEEIGRGPEALVFYDRLFQIIVPTPEMWLNRGRALLKSRKFFDAADAYRAAIKIRPDFFDAHNNLANVLCDINQPMEAMQEILAAQKLRPNDSRVLLNRSRIYFELQEYENALAQAELIIKHDPSRAAAYLNKSAALFRLKRIPEAISTSEKALELKCGDYPDAEFNIATLSLAQGDYERGWRMYECRWKTRDASLQSSSDRPIAPSQVAQELLPSKVGEGLWSGSESLNGKTVFIYFEQGLGDTIQFSRYLWALRELGAHIILMVQKPLKELYEEQDLCAQVISFGDPIPDFDYHRPLLGLPYVFETRLNNIPAKFPYIIANREKVERWVDRLSIWSRIRVGLVWSGGLRIEEPEHWSTNGRRNIPLAFLEPLNEINVDFFSLQKGEDGISQLRELETNRWAGPTIVDFTDELRNFSDTAALISCLDLVISVDTSTAHLTGMMDKPVWLLNRYDTCWRWMLDRSDSPWYPTMRIFRQPSPGDWQSVINEVKGALREFVEFKSAHGKR